MGDLNELEEELKQLSEERAVLKDKLLKMEEGPEKQTLIEEIKRKEYEALFNYFFVGCL
jgi:cell division protein FtsB